MTATRTRGRRAPVWRCAEAVTALVVALLVTIAPGVSDADAGTDDIEAPDHRDTGRQLRWRRLRAVRRHVRRPHLDGAFQVPYRITAPVDPEDGNGAVVVEPPHFATGLGTLEFQLGRNSCSDEGSPVPVSATARRQLVPAWTSASSTQAFRAPTSRRLRRWQRPNRRRDRR